MFLLIVEYGTGIKRILGSMKEDNLVDLFSKRKELIYYFTNDTGVDLSIKVVSEDEFKAHENFSFFKTISIEGVSVGM